MSTWTLELSGWLSWLSTSFNIFQRSALAPIPSMRHVFLFQIMHARAGSYIEFSGSWKLGAKVTSGASLHWKVLIFAHPTAAWNPFGTCPGPVVFARGRNIFGLIASHCTQARIFRRLECLNSQVAGKLLAAPCLFNSFYSIKIWIRLALTSLGWIATWAAQVAVARWTCDVYTGWPWAKITRIQQADPQVHDSREAKLRASPSLGHRGRSSQGITSASTKQWK